MNLRNSSPYVASFVALVAAACADSGPSAADLNRGGSGTISEGGTSGTDPGTGGVSPGTGGGTPGAGTGPDSGGTAGAAPSGGGPTGGSGGSIATGGTTGGVAGGTGGTGAIGGAAGSDIGPTGGTGGGMAGGTAGSGAMGGAGAGGGGSGGGGPYDPRSGTFRMLVYSRTLVFPHTDSIATGKTMLQQIATEQGFTVTLTEQNTDITPTGLAQYEVVFFLNTTGNVFNATEQQTFETWMTTKNGAFVGVHSATDTANGWAFYAEVTGQYYDGHELCCSQASIQWDSGAANHVAVRGLPSPWPRSEEWYNFNRASDWSTKPGFQILSRVTINNVSRPVSYTRQYRNFRSFYTSLGHQPSVFQDANVKRHVAAGIMWAARREHLLR